MTSHYPERHFKPVETAMYWLDRAHIAELRAHTKPGNKFNELMAEARMCRAKSRRIAFGEIAPELGTFIPNMGTTSPQKIQRVGRVA
jgi:hypothetical protein